MPRRPHHQAATCTDATAHPRRGHHRTTSYTSCSVRSPGSCRLHRQVRRPGTTAPSPRLHLPFLPSTRHTPRRHSTRLGLFAGKVKALFRLARSPGLIRWSGRGQAIRRLSQFCRVKNSLPMPETSHTANCAAQSQESHCSTTPEHLECESPGLPP
jgi:hypothetical protein